MALHDDPQNPATFCCVFFKRRSLWIFGRIIIGNVFVIFSCGFHIPCMSSDGPDGVETNGGRSSPILRNFSGLGSVQRHLGDAEFQ